MSRKFSLNHSRSRVTALMLLGLIFTLSIPSIADEVKTELNAAVEAVRPALIRIHVVSSDFEQGRVIKTEAYGSGVIISPDGYAITNHHVAQDAESLVCTLADKNEVDAKLIGEDPLADIAIIKLISPDNKPFPYAKWGDSSKLEVGDRVFAMGSPYALSQSVTMGMISNAEMMLPEYIGGDFTMEGEDVGSIVRWIGHDALIREGNSGGPLINRDGEIVGINEISFGLSGAIPCNLAKEVAEKLIKDGKVVRSWLGLEVQPMLSSLNQQKGILVSGVLTDSPSQKAGFKTGDILLSLDGREAVAKFREEIPIFNQFVADIPVGKACDAKVLRDGKEMTISVTTTARPKAMEKQRELRGWGICGTNITYQMQKEEELKSQDGVYVTGILPSGPVGTAKPSMQEGDVIVKVGDEAIKDITSLRAVTKKLTDGKDEQVPAIVQFNRRSKQFITVVKIGKEEQAKPSTAIAKAWLPIDMQVITREIAEALAIPNKTGVRITQVYSKTSAEKAGLKIGDLILKLDGEDISAEQIGDEEVLPDLIRQYDIGAEVKLGILRDGKPMNINVKLETTPKPTRDYPKYVNDDFEFVARDIAFSDRAQGDVDPDQSGILIQSVSEGSWTALGGLRTGDIVTKINGTGIQKLSDLEKTLIEVTKSKPKTVVFAVKRGIHTLFVEVKPNWSELDS